MTELQQISRRLSKIEAALKIGVPEKDQYLDRHQIQKMLGISNETLRSYRRDKKLNNWKCSETKRNYTYSLNEIKSVFNK